ncbi:hypothetical protein ABIE65_002043 [Constrictibacter sp. MBR-5]|jgi:hypothetical protein|uniref:capsid assembly protein n=1 Tax=Constrictibacter sp. MBR-5 TaxID=3156467 RepID=UPI00339834C3
MTTTTETTNTTVTEETKAPVESPNSLLSNTETNDKTEESSTETNEVKETTEEAPKLLAGKYKTPEALEEGYKNLVKKLAEKGPQPLEEITPDILKTAMDEAGWEALPADENPEVYEKFIGELKDKGFTTQEQINNVFKLGSTWLAEHVANVGPSIDIPAEQAALEKEWGAEFKGKVDAVTKFAKANLEPDVYEPLGRTAAGMKFLESYMNSNSNGVLSNTLSNADSANTLESLQNELQEVNRNPDYLKSKSLQAKATELATRIVAIKKGRR